ncbi:hypothetical protein CDD81_3988 [Ophiocordyceps australis]|uniref:Uncharacterized protein n=1 Tax=Ophiocordyceps australis TaxID=1399860 RepID=A0A2C5YAI9_9HYPO|nr:hypothetical protein CDD81_3988 [Ophiocordyceps australis]
MAYCITAPAHLPDLVRRTFSKARSSGDLSYYPTKVAVLNVGNVPFQLRFSPSLANKPKAPTGQHPPSDPFCYTTASASPLFVTDIGPTHYLVLNKFCIVPEHFILATTALRQQTHVLEPADIAAAWACIIAYEPANSQENTDKSDPPQQEMDIKADPNNKQGDNGLFVFFNSGPESGASQPHRHIQLLPITAMYDGLDYSHPRWNVLANSQSVHNTLPFTCFSEPISSPDDAYAAYLRLYRRACDAVTAHKGQSLGSSMNKIHSDASISLQKTNANHESLTSCPARISYNMAMTNRSILLCPRLSEGATLAMADSCTPHAVNVAFNGTLLAGALLAKSEIEWNILRNDPTLLGQTLSKIGVPKKQL